MKSYSLKLRIIFILVLFFGIFSFVTNSQAATTFYVIPSDDTACIVDGDGTANQCASANGQPGYWRGFSNIRWGTGPKQVGPGNTLYLIGGKTYYETLTLDGSGSDGMPITITVSGGGPATIDGQNTRDSAINTGGRSFITIDGARGNAVAGDTDYGFVFQNHRNNCVYTASGGSHINILHMDCKNLSLPRQHGTHTGSDGATTLTDSTQSWTNNEWVNWGVINVTGNSVAGITANTSTTITGTLGNQGGSGRTHWDYGDKYVIYWSDDVGGIRLTLEASEIELAYNWIHGSPDGATDESLRWPVSCIVLWAAESGTARNTHKIHHNKCEYLGMDAIKSGSNTSLYNNYVASVHLPMAHSDGLLIQSGNHAAIYNNYVAGSTQCIYLDSVGSGMNDIQVFNNLVDCRTGSFGFTAHVDPTGPISNVGVYNNTFIGSNYIMLVHSAASVTNLDIRNNYFGSPGNGGPQISVRTSSISNLNYNVYKTAEKIAWVDGVEKDWAGLTGLGYERLGSRADPSFTSDWQLQVGDTVAKDKGADLSSLCSSMAALCFDKNGVSRPQGSAWGIGAYEYVQGGDTTPPAAPTGLSVR
jgi:hypothetical protein